MSSFHTKANWLCVLHRRVYLQLGQQFPFSFQSRPTHLFRFQFSVLLVTGETRVASHVTLLLLLESIKLCRLLLNLRNYHILFISMINIVTIRPHRFVVCCPNQIGQHRSGGLLRKQFSIWKVLVSIPSEKNNYKIILISIWSTLATVTSQWRQCSIVIGYSCAHPAWALSPLMSTF